MIGGPGLFSMLLPLVWMLLLIGVGIYLILRFARFVRAVEKIAETLTKQN